MAHDTGQRSVSGALVCNCSGGPLFLYYHWGKLSVHRCCVGNEIAVHL